MVLPARPGGARRWIERQVELTSRTHGVWHGFVPDVGVGTRYGYRAAGRWDPALGYRHNPAKLLLDPYARAIDGRLHLRPEVFGHVVDDAPRAATTTSGRRDSAPFVPQGVVAGDDRSTGAATRRRDVPVADTVVYEAHVKALTRLHARRPRGAARHVRGPRPPGGDRAPAAARRHDGRAAARPRVQRTSLRWCSAGMRTTGATTRSASSPRTPRYAARRRPAGGGRRVQGHGAALHAAGLEVMLDVVYNHTCRGRPRRARRCPGAGWTTAAYYRLDADGRVRRRHRMRQHPGPAGTRRRAGWSLDSLRYWVEEMHVDGFRFDLASALARGRDDGFDPDHPFLVAHAQPTRCSRGVKLIAEPWDVGLHGWRTGQFPPPLAEWNDRYRDAVRTFWLATARRRSRGSRPRRARPGHPAGRLAGPLRRRDRGPLASVNFVTAHDGFTLRRPGRPTTQAQRGQRRGQPRRVERQPVVEPRRRGAAPTDPAIAAARRRSMRNLLATLLLSTGVPML